MTASVLSQHPNKDHIFRLVFNITQYFKMKMTQLQYNKKLYLDQFSVPVFPPHIHVTTASTYIWSKGCS